VNLGTKSTRSSRRLILAASAVPLALVLLSGCVTEQNSVVETPSTPTSDASTVKAFVRTGQELEIRRSNVNVSITADGGDVLLTGDGLTVQITGNVEDLTLDGSNNTLKSDDSVWLEVNGDRNTATGGSVSQTVRVEGVRNTVTFGGAPYVRVRGTNNTVNGKAQ
jgi:Protein of unknown function (DUF3060)